MLWIRKLDTLSKSVTNGPPNPFQGVGLQMVSPNPIIPPSPPNPRLLLHMDLIYPAHNLLKTHGPNYHIQILHTQITQP